MPQLYRRQGDEFVANSVKTGDQLAPKVVKLASGGFLMVWTDMSGLTDASGAGIIGQRFDAAGNKVGGEFLVNTATGGNQTLAAVTALASGGFVVSWSDGGNGNVEKAQIFDTAGSKAGAEFAFDSASPPFLLAGVYHLAGLAGGGFVAINNGGAGQVFDATGAKVGGAFTTGAGFSSADVEALPGGGFVVVAAAFAPEFQMQFFDSAGAKLGNALIIATPDRAHRDIDVAVLANGGFAVTWRGDDSAYVHARILDAAGAPVGAELLLGREPNWTVSEPRVAALPSGDFLVTWTKSAIEGTVESVVVAQVVDAAGAKVGSQFLVSTQTDHPNQNHGQSSIAVLDSGAFVVAWHGAGPGDPRSPGATVPNIDGGIRAQIFSPLESPALDIVPSASSLSESAVENIAALRLTTMSAAVNNAYSYELIADSTGGAFRIEGDLLVVADSGLLDFEAHPSVSVTVRATDIDGNVLEETIALTVADAIIEHRYAAGPEIRVNDTLDWSQSGATIQALASGGFVVSWTDGSFAADGTGSAVKAQLFAADGGAMGAEFVVNTTTSSIQEQPSVTELASGGFVIAWTDLSTSSTIRAQLFDAAGAKLGGELVVSATGSSQFGADVAGLAGGGFVVTWLVNSASLGDGSGTGVKLQRFDAMGNKLGGEVFANTTTAADQSEAVVAGLPGGGFVVTWTDRSGQGGDAAVSSIKAQLFDAADAKLGGEFLVNSATAGSQAQPSIAVLASGQFVVSWTDSSRVGGDTSGSAIKAQLFAADGSRIGGELLVNTLTSGSQLDSSVTALPGGGFAISWSDLGPGIDTDDFLIRAQIFDASGNRVGASFEVNSAAVSNQFSSSLTGLTSGAIAAVWLDESRSSFLDDVKLRLFTLESVETPGFVLGTPRDDVLIGTPGADEMRGLAGSDAYFVDHVGDVVIELANEGYDIIYAGVSYALAANSFVEVLATIDNTATTPINLTGNALANYLVGNAGANLLDGGAGPDQLWGRGGDDSYYADAGDDVVEYAGDGYDIVYARSSYGLGVGQAIEVLATIDNTATTAINLIGNALSNYIVGNAGSNTLNGGGGDDQLWGREGDDSYIADMNDIVLEYAGQGSDILYATASYILAAGLSIEALATVDNTATTAIDLYGNELDNYVTGNAGANTLDGGTGSDTLWGRGGDDSYFADGNDVVREDAGQGNDIIYARGSFVLGTGVSVEILATVDNTASTAINLTGNELDNYVTGNAGANVLNGGLGADQLFGRGGADTFAFTTALGGGNVDQILDFMTGADKIALDDAVFTGLTPGALPNGAFALGSSAQEADDRILYNPQTGQLFFDADGSGAGAAILFATVTPGTGLSPSDFMVI